MSCIHGLQQRGLLLMLMITFLSNKNLGYSRPEVVGGDRPRFAKMQSRVRTKWVKILERWSEGKSEEVLPKLHTSNKFQRSVKFV